MDEYYPPQPEPQAPMPMEYGTGGMDMMPYQQVDDASLVKATRPEKVIDEIEHRLKGEIYDDNTEKWIIPKGVKPLINEIGIRSIMIDIRSIMNQNTILSNLRDDEVSHIIVGLGDTIITKLMMRHEEFGVDQAELTTIVYLVCNTSYCALKRGYFEGERRFLKTTTQEKIGVMQYPQQMQEKKSAWSKFKLFGK